MQSIFRFRRALLLSAASLVACCLVAAMTYAQGVRIDPRGEPKGFKAGLSARYAVWYDAKDNVWRVRTTTAKKLHRFHGEVRVVGGEITGLSSHALEAQGKAEDHWRANKQAVTFDFKTDKGIDGINLRLGKNVTAIHFDLRVDGAHHPGEIEQ